MRVHSIVFSILLLSFQGDPAFAQWPSSIRQMSVRFTAPAVDNFVYTLWAGLRAPSLYQDQIPHLEKFRLPSKLFKNHGVRTLGVLQKDSAGKIRRAPLVFVLPGIFSNRNDRLSLQPILILSRLGYHVLTVPNPWSVGYIVDEPKNTVPGDLTEEARQVRDLIYNQTLILKAQNAVESVEVVGFSYGAFLAAAVAALDAESKTPVISGRTHMLSPPLELRHSMSIVDEIADEFAPEFENHTVAWDFLRNYGAYINAASPDLVHPAEARKAPGFMIYASFILSLRNSVGTFENVHKTGARPHYSDDAAYRGWYKDMRFRKYLSLFAPGMLSKYTATDEDLLGHWLQRAKNHGYDRFQILSAKDDFLNRSPRWIGSWSAIDPQDLILLERGGHLGYATEPWFMQLLGTLFPPISVASPVTQ